MTRPNSIRANVSAAAREVGAAAGDSRELVAELRELVAVFKRFVEAIEKNGVTVEGKHIPVGVNIETQKENES